MRHARAGLAVLTALLLSPLAAGPAVAQDDERPNPMPELLERLGQVEARIGFLQEHFEGARGEDVELFADQLARRWREHHDLLLEMVAATEEAREAGAERPDATERIRVALGEELEFVRGRVDALRERIADVRLALPDAPPEELGGLELQLTDLNAALDRLVKAGVEDIEMAGVVGLDLGPQVELVDRWLAHRAAVIAARIELALDRRNKLLARTDRPAADSAAVLTELNAVDEKLHGTTASLQAMVELLDRRGLQTADYRRLLLRATGDLGTLDVEVVRSEIAELWAEFRGWLDDHSRSILARIFTIVGVLVLFGLLARLGRQVTRKIVGSARVQASELLKKLLVGIASKLVWLIGFLVVLSVVGIDVGPMLAGLGIAGFVLGFALQDTLANFAAGLMIMIYRPFDEGDIITAGGVTGHVREVTLVSTVVTTFDNQVMIVPNGKVWGDVINNVTAQDKRRVDLVFGIGYGDDMRKAQGIMQDVLSKHELVLDDPAPVVRVHNLGDSSVDFVCRPWCSTQDYWTVHWDVTETVKRRFDEEGVSIPFPQRDVHIYNQAADGTGAPVA